MMWSNGRRSKSLIAYTQVEDETNAEAPTKEDFTFSQPTELSGPWGSKVPARFSYLLVLQSFVIVVLLLYITIKQRPSDAACARQLSPYCK